MKGTDENHSVKYMNIGLVLSGGMAKGAYQIGVLRAISEYIPISEIKYISCASIGVLNGYAFVTNKLDLAEEMWRNVCINDTRFFINQILRSSMLQQNIVKACSLDDVVCSHLYCTLFNLNHRNIVYKDLSTVEVEKMPLYLKASVAMPLYNKSVKIDETSYFDGAMVDNIPVYPILMQKLDYVICVHFDDCWYKFKKQNYDDRVINITFPNKNIVKQSVIFKQNSIEKMLKDGYNMTDELLKLIFTDGYDNLDSVYKNIKYLNSISHRKYVRITGDAFVTNLNKFAQILTKKQII